MYPLYHDKNKLYFDEYDNVLVLYKHTWLDLHSAS